MAKSHIPGHITRSQAVKRYGRAMRTIEREISFALAMRDEEVLRHLKLRTKDDVRREGIDVTPDIIVKLRDEGMVPTWYLETIFFDKKYRRTSDDAESLEDDVIEDEGTDEEGTGDKDMEYTPHRTLPVKDAVIVGSDDDTGALALLTNPMIQIQAKRINDLEKDRTSDREIITTLRETIDLQNKRDQNAFEAEQAKSREGSTDEDSNADKKGSTDQLKAQVEKSFTKKWFNTPISELLSRFFGF